MYHWGDIDGKGRVLSWTTFYRGYLPAYPAPHTVVAVELDAGPIMIGYVLREETLNLAINTAVRLRYGRHPDGYAIPYFTLAIFTPPTTLALSDRPETPGVI
jgi:uncharacterized OB-fold protein